MMKELNCVYIGVRNHVNFKHGESEVVKTIDRDVIKSREFFSSQFGLAED